jgi:hypothetical protein
VTSPLPLKIIAGVLFAAGCGFFAWALAFGVFAIAFEILLAQGAEAALDSKAVLDRIQLVGWFMGVALGALLFWRWHRADPALPSRIKRAIVYGFTAAGATHLAYLIINGAPVGAMVLVAFASLVAGSLLAAIAYGPPRPVLPFIGRAIGAGLAGFVILWFALAFDKGMRAPYDALGKERILWVKVTFPDSHPRPTYNEIKVDLRTPTQIVKCFPINWEDERGRTVLPMRCDFTELTADREVLITFPKQAPLVLKMPFARNPKPMYNYSGWINLPNGIAYIYRVT